LIARIAGDKNHVSQRLSYQNPRSREEEMGLPFT
jgi:hypothetical protein